MSTELILSESIVLHNSVQCLDVQSAWTESGGPAETGVLLLRPGWPGDVMSGIGAGYPKIVHLLACCEFHINVGSYNMESNLAVINARYLAKCIASWFFDVPWLTMLTTAKLSHWAST